MNDDPWCKHGNLLRCDACYLETKIERVIANLNVMLNNSDKLADTANGSLYREGIHIGEARGYSKAINMLEEVIASDVPTSNRQTGPSSTDDTTK